MHDPIPDHYATLGLDRDCPDAHIRTAYRLLAKQHHPDVNSGSPDSIARTQALNAAYEILGDSTRRQAYDDEIKAAHKTRSHKPTILRDIPEESHLSIDDFLRGTELEVKVNDPANSGRRETYTLTIPPDTAPGSRFRIPRKPPFEGGCILVKLKVRPDFRFKVRGSDLRCDLRITAHRAAQGGSEMVMGALGNSLRVSIPRGVGRGEILRLPGEGLPKTRGGRGDLLVRITYRPEVHISRKTSRQPSA